MEALLVKYGYVLIFLGVAIEGEAVLVAASYLAHKGIFSLPVVLLLAVVANSTADQIYFSIARSRGTEWLEARFGRSKKYVRTVGWVRRHANWLLLVNRYIFGFRILIPAACGALGMSPSRFTVLNLMSGIIWALPVGLLGFYLGAGAEALFANARHYETWAMLVFMGIASAILLLRLLKRTRRDRMLRVDDLHSLIPILTGFIGFIDIISAIWPRSAAQMHVIQSWLPLEVTQNSRPLMLFSGIALLQVTRSLARRKELAWYITTTVVSFSLLLHVTRALDIHHSLAAGLLLAYLISFRHRFHVRSDPASIRNALVLVPILALFILIYGYIGLTDMREQIAWHPGSNPLNQAFRCGILTARPGLDPITPHAVHFLGSLQVAGWLARLYILVLLLRPVIQRKRLTAPADVVESIFKNYSRYSLSAFAVQDDKHHLLAAGNRALIAFSTRGSVAIACGDPLAAEEDFEASVREYTDYCRRNGWTPCIYEAAEEKLPIYGKLGLQYLKLAEEAMIDLKEFSLAGGKRANLRAMVNKTRKTGMKVLKYESGLKRDPHIEEQLEAVSAEWLDDKRLPEMGFTLGRFSLEGLKGVPVFVGTLDGEVKAFCTWIPYRNGQSAVLDLMRKRKDAVSGAMDLLLAESLLQLKDEGFTEASLSNAPLANINAPHDTLDRGVKLLFENMNSFYGYKNLFQFKKKFSPRWEGRHLVYPAGTDLPRVAYALLRIHNSGGLLRLLLRK
jgi:phosphatidylglycerol lysyltransferase